MKKLRLTMVYEKSATQDEYDFLMECIKDGDFKAVEEDFEIGWTRPGKMDLEWANEEG